MLRASLMRRLMYTVLLSTMTVKLERLEIANFTIVELFHQLHQYKSKRFKISEYCTNRIVSLKNDFLPAIRKQPYSLHDGADMNTIAVSTKFSFVYH